MKHFIYFMLLFATALGITSCNSKKKSNNTIQTVEAITNKNYNDLLKQDFEKIKDTFPDVVFYESQITLNNLVTEPDVQIKSVTNVFQAGRCCYQVYHYKDTVKCFKFNDYWLEDVKVDPYAVISFEDALANLNKANVKKPESKFITLRSPLGPSIQNPGYFVGSAGRGFVKIDAITGDVIPM